MGYLHFDATDEKYEIGPINSLQYKLVRCLFSPSNTNTAQYNSVRQTIERVFGCLYDISQGSVHGVSTEKLLEMQAAVRRVVQSVERKEAGKFLHFTWGAGTLQMAVVEVL